MAKFKAFAKFANLKQSPIIKLFTFTFIVVLVFVYIKVPSGGGGYRGGRGGYRQNWKTHPSPGGNA